MLYEAEPRVRRIPDLKSKHTTGQEKKTNLNMKNDKSSHDKSDVHKSRRKSSSTHTRPKNTSQDSYSCSSSSNRLQSNNKSDTKRPSRSGSSKNKNVKSVKGSSSDDLSKSSK